MTIHHQLSYYFSKRYWRMIIRYYPDCISISFFMILGKRIYKNMISSLNHLISYNWMSLPDYSGDIIYFSILIRVIISFIRWWILVRYKPFSMLFLRVFIRTMIFRLRFWWSPHLNIISLKWTRNIPIRYILRSYSIIEIVSLKSVGIDISSFVLTARDLEGESILLEVIIIDTIELVFFHSYQNQNQLGIPSLVLGSKGFILLFLTIIRDGFWLDYIIELLK